MIIVKLTGGLGNQMFQYAFGRQLSLHHGAELKLDISEFEKAAHRKNFTPRTFGLNVFSVSALVASVRETESFKTGKAGKLMDMVSLKLSVKRKSFYLREPHFHFFKEALKAPGNCYIDGYWQSEKYFSGIRQQLLSDFEIALPLSQEVIRLAEQVNNENSVSIHVRKGDYISIPVNRSVYAVCGGDYYINAIKYITGKYPGTKFYVFSDEPGWFRENVKTNADITFVNENRDNKDHEDLFLMSCCKHNIIANSSFSWWGAWLNKNDEKTVIAPKNWFADRSKNDRDLVPGNWIKL